MSGNDERPDRLRAETRQLLEESATARGRSRELENAFLYESEGMAAAIIENIMFAMIAAEEVFRDYHRSLHPNIFQRFWRWFLENVWKR